MSYEAADQDAAAPAADLEELDIQVVERARLDGENRIAEIDDVPESDQDAEKYEIDGDDHDDDEGSVLRNISCERIDVELEQSKMQAAVRSLLIGLLHRTSLLFLLFRAVCLCNYSDNCFVVNSKEG